IRCTAPAVDSVIFASILDPGLRGAGTCNGAAGVKPKLFLLSCIANPPIGCIALFVKVISILICPFLRHILHNVPQISKPLPFSAGNQLTLGDIKGVGPWLKPNMSPSRPVVL
ncbi:hypothetical protein ALC62_11839, partial [Cyphomyrmex costatus]